MNNTPPSKCFPDIIYDHRFNKYHRALQQHKMDIVFGDDTQLNLHSKPFDAFEALHISKHHHVSNKNTIDCAELVSVHHHHETIMTNDNNSCFTGHSDNNDVYDNNNKSNYDVDIGDNEIIINNNEEPPNTDYSIDSIYKNEYHSSYQKHNQKHYQKNNQKLNALKDNTLPLTHQQHVLYNSDSSFDHFLKTFTTPIEQIDVEQWSKDLLIITTEEQKPKNVIETQKSKDLLIITTEEQEPKNVIETQQSKDLLIITTEEQEPKDVDELKQSTESTTTIFESKLHKDTTIENEFQSQDAPISHSKSGTLNLDISLKEILEFTNGLSDDIYSRAILSISTITDQPTILPTTHLISSATLSITPSTSTMPSTLSTSSTPTTSTIPSTSSTSSTPTIPSTSTIPSTLSTSSTPTTSSTPSTISSPSIEAAYKNVMLGSTDEHHIYIYQYKPESVDKRNNFYNNYIEILYISLINGDIKNALLLVENKYKFDDPFGAEYEDHIFQTSLIQKVNANTLNYKNIVEAQESFDSLWFNYLQTHDILLNGDKRYHMVPMAIGSVNNNTSIFTSDINYAIILYPLDCNDGNNMPNVNTLTQLFKQWVEQHVVNDSIYIIKYKYGVTIIEDVYQYDVVPCFIINEHYYIYNDELLYTINEKLVSHILATCFQTYKHSRELIVCLKIIFKKYKQIDFHITALESLVVQLTRRIGWSKWTHLTLKEKILLSLCALLHYADDGEILYDLHSNKHNLLANINIYGLKYFLKNIITNIVNDHAYVVTLLDNYNKYFY